MRRASAVAAALGLALRAAAAAPGPATPVAPPRALCGGGAEVPLDVASHGRPFVHMRLGSVSGAFLVDTGSSFSSIDAAAYGQVAGARVSATGSSLPTVSRGDDLRAADLSGVPGPSRTTGIIGTDFLSNRTTEFHYEGAEPHLVLSEAPCGDLSGRGLLRFDERGLFGPPSRTRPPDANLPSVFMRIGPVRFRAWVDTGFYEDVPGRPAGAVKANAALVAELRAAGVRLDPAGGVTSVTCDGRTHADPVARASEPLVEEGGDPAAGVASPMVQEVSADACGGPGNVRTPLGMVGVAWLARWGTLVLDPLGGAVWVGRARR